MTGSNKPCYRCYRWHAAGKPPRRAPYLKGMCVHSHKLKDGFSTCNFFIDHLKQPKLKYRGGGYKDYG